MPRQPGIGVGHVGDTDQGLAQMLPWMPAPTGAAASVPGSLEPGLDLFGIHPMQDIFRRQAAQAFLGR